MDDSLLNNLPGTRDLLPDEMPKWHAIEERARQIFSRYGFQEIRTPIIEATELFVRSIGGDTDIVGKEMYTFLDQSEKSITLRPEATASVVRSYAQHFMYRGGGLTKLYYIGPMFRHEKKQKGRWRQFFQVGAEVLGSDHPAVEAEVIDMVLSLLGSLGVTGRLLTNSVGCPRCRPAYVKTLREELATDLARFCEDCRRRSETNPLRVLDCKVENCQPLISQLPMITDHLCPDCADHFARFRNFMDLYGIPYEIVPRLVRGLDYYVRTAFEIVSGELGAQNALAGGGRYDGLSEVLGGPPVQGFGFAMGMDRLAMLLPDEGTSSWKWSCGLFIAHLGDAAFRKAIELSRDLRSVGLDCYLDFSQGSLKSQMRLANKLLARNVLIIGENELARDVYVVKRMADSHQWDTTLPDLIDYLKKEGRGPRAEGRE